MTTIRPMSDEEDFQVSLEMRSTFLKRREADLQMLTTALKEENYSAFSILAQKLRGSSASYGFSSLEVIISGLERAGAEKRNSEARHQISALEKWVSTIRKEFEVQ